MRRIVAVLTLMALTATFIVPAAVFAKGPPADKGPAVTPPGLAKKAAAPEVSEVAGEPDDSGELEVPAKDQRREEKAERKTERQSEPAGKALRNIERAQVRSEEASGPADGTGPIGEQKRTGIEMALSRILLNIERAEARVEAGEQSKVPPGLLKVVSKFLGWLGLDVDDGGDGTDPGNGSDEETGTALPPGGSDDGTMTVDPAFD